MPFSRMNWQHQNGESIAQWESAGPTYRKSQIRIPPLSPQPKDKYKNLISLYYLVSRIFLINSTLICGLFLNCFGNFFPIITFLGIFLVLFNITSFYKYRTNYNYAQKSFRYSDYCFISVSAIFANTSLFYIEAIFPLILYSTIYLKEVSIFLTLVLLILSVKTFLFHALSLNSAFFIGVSLIGMGIASLKVNLLVYILQLSEYLFTKIQSDKKLKELIAFYSSRLDLYEEIFQLRNKLNDALPWERKKIIKNLLNLEDFLVLPLEEYEKKKKNYSKDYYPVLFSQAGKFYVVLFKPKDPLFLENEIYREKLQYTTRFLTEYLSKKLY